MRRTHLLALSAYPGLVVSLFVLGWLLQTNERQLETNVMGSRILQYRANPLMLAATAAMIWGSVSIIILSVKRVLSFSMLFALALVGLHGLGAAILATMEYPWPWLVTMTSLGCFAIGVSMAWAGARHPLTRPRPHLLRWGERGLLILVLCCLGALVLLSFIALGTAPLVSAILAIAQDDVNSAATLLIEGRKAQYYDTSSYWGQGYFELIRVGLLPSGCALLLFDSLRRQQAGQHPRWAATTFWGIFGLAVTLVSGQRWPMAFYVLTLLIIYAHCLGRLSRRVLLLTCIGTFLGLAGLSLLNYRVRVEGLSLVEGLIALLESLAYRITIASHTPFYHALDVFPRRLDYQYGSTWLGDLLAYLPGPDINFGTLYAELIGMKWGSAPLTLLGEAFANGGWVGVGVVFFVVGYAGGLFDRLVYPWMMRTAWSEAAYLLLAIGAVRIMFGSSIGMLSYHGLPVLFWGSIFWGWHLLTAAMPARSVAKRGSISFNSRTATIPG